MLKKLHLLVVDDDNDFSRDFAVLSKDLFKLSFAFTGEEGLEMLNEEDPDAIILDLRLGAGIDGIETLRRIRVKHADIPVIMVTEYASVETAVQAMKLGAFHYTSKHPNMKELHAIIQRELRNAVWKTLFLDEVHKKYGELVGGSPAMKEVYRQITKVAPTKINILLEGESGTGKELLAREIHGRSGRAQHPFIPVNCAAIPDTLFESEIFGHERGAFTGAIQRKIGKLEMADEGTLFLDEISTLSPMFQPKFLRSLEEKCFTRIGGNDEIQVDIRIISATNKVVADEMESGRFREDLFHRINGITIHVPPLRERVEDIPQLAAYFVRKISLNMGRPAQSFKKETVNALKKYHWPGNVRELQNIIERALALVDDRPIEPSDLNLSTHSVAPVSVQDVMTLPYHQAKAQILNQFKKTYLKSLVERHQGNISAAAKEAGISRTGLYRVMRDEIED